MAGTSVMRRDPFLSLGGYHERYHIGAEKSLLALDFLARGWEMIDVDDLIVYHYPHAAGRVPERRPVDARVEALLDALTELPA